MNIFILKTHLVICCAASVVNLERYASLEQLENKIFYLWKIILAYIGTYILHRKRCSAYIVN
jgi:hypothetical protein